MSIHHVAQREESLPNHALFVERLREDSDRILDQRARRRWRAQRSRRAYTAKVFLRRSQSCLYSTNQAREIGGLCSVNTSANVVVPGSVKDTKRAIVEIGVITITDGGADGLNGTAPNTLFETQGIFIP